MLSRWVVLGAIACLVAPPRSSAKDEAREEAAASSGFPFGMGRAARRVGAGLLPPDVDRAIDAALDWLAAHQSPDGGWECRDHPRWCDGKPTGRGAEPGLGRPDFDVGVTGLALCAFLGVGHTHLGDDPRARVVRAGLAYLAGKQDAEGCFGPRTSEKYVYNHALGTLAVVEAYAMTEDADLLPAARRAVGFVSLARNPYFAWRYGVKPGDNDTSVTAWMTSVCAAARTVDRTARDRGLPEPLSTDLEAFDGAKTWIDKMTDPDFGRAGYIQRGGNAGRPPEHVDRFPFDKTESTTAMACWVRTLIGEDPAKSELIVKGTQVVARLPPRWNTQDGSIDMVFWYFASLFLYQVGGEPWKAWEAALQTALAGAQRADGDACGLRGSWDPVDPWSHEGGRVYSTAILALALETPLRYERKRGKTDPVVEAIAKRARDPKAPEEQRVRAFLLLRDGAREAARKALDAVTGDTAGRRLALLVLAERPSWALENGKRLAVWLRKDKAPRVRAAAARALARIPADERPALDDLVSALADPDPEVRGSALEALRGARLSDAQIASVEGLMAGGDTKTALRAAGVLRAARPGHARALELLRTHLRGQDAELRTLALGELGAAAPPAWARVSESQLDHAIERDVPSAFENRLGMRFVLVPPGTYHRGSPPDEKERLSVETLHEVSLSRPFYVQATEVTNAQYRAFRKDHHSQIHGAWRTDDDAQPAVSLGHDDALLFADWLTSRDPAYRYRLPTEAEWEYVARAGTTTRFWWGDSEADAGKHENVADLAGKKGFPAGYGKWVELHPAWRWFETTDGHVLTAPVASFPPNPWSLHDVLGNVAEWCSDWEGDYPAGKVVDPTGPPSGAHYVYRGGSFIASPQMARSAMRQLMVPWLEPGRPCVWVGLRLVAEPAGSAPAR